MKMAICDKQWGQDTDWSFGAPGNPKILSDRKLPFWEFMPFQTNYAIEVFIMQIVEII